MDMTGAAVVASMLYNINRGKGTSAASAEDFLPKWRTQKADADLLMSKVQRIAAAFGGRKKKKAGGGASECGS